jgi:hypothetical protein
MTDGQPDRDTLERSSFRHSEVNQRGKSRWIVARSEDCRRRSAQPRLVSVLAMEAGTKRQIRRS